MLYEQGERKKGVDLWKESVAMNASPVALRNLAYDARINGDIASALSYMKQAVELENNSIDKVFSEEYMDLLLSQQKYAEVWDYYQKLPLGRKSADRINVLAGLAAVRLDEYAFVEELFKKDLACVREGDTSLTDMFFTRQARALMKEKGLDEQQAETYARRNTVPPSHIDFRMFVKKE
jgi:hypothetical protein